MRPVSGLILAALLAASVTTAQDDVSLRVDLGAARQPFSTAWSHFGYDEPNYTYAPDGLKLIRELSALSPVPVYIRTHNLLTSGDGSAALKWGSTNVYTLGGDGRPVYDWAILDKIFDAIVENGAKPLVEIGFMPEALSTHPRPYRHEWPKGDLWTGWAYPPRDYREWGELVYRWVRHSVERYGKEEVLTWKWEVWNEPDIGYWQGTPEEFYKLYDFATDAVKRALPGARVGGPDSTGPADAHAAAFLRGFLEHCAGGANSATGRKGTPLDFVSFHAKGNPTVVNGHVRMGIKRQLQSIEEGFRIVKSFSEFAHLPVILGESDPEGCAACSAREHPENAYRNGALYAAYTAESTARTLELAAANGVALEGIVTWAFEFEGRPYFAGFRTLATNGVDKPILNLFRMLGVMGQIRLLVASDHTLPLDSILRSGIADRPDISALAALRENELSVLVWNYHDDDIPGPDEHVELSIRGVPPSVGRALVRHYRLDQHRSNSYSAWLELGSPQQPTVDQRLRLGEAGQLQLLSSPQWVRTGRGDLELNFTLPRHAVSLVQITW